MVDSRYEYKNPKAPWICEVEALDESRNEAKLHVLLFILRPIYNTDNDNIDDTAKSKLPHTESHPLPSRTKSAPYQSTKSPSTYPPSSQRPHPRLRLLRNRALPPHRQHRLGHSLRITLRAPVLIELYRACFHYDGVSVSGGGTYSGRGRWGGGITLGRRCCVLRILLILVSSFRSFAL